MDRFPGEDEEEEDDDDDDDDDDDVERTMEERGVWLYVVGHKYVKEDASEWRDDDDDSSGGGSGDCCCCD